MKKPFVVCVDMDDTIEHLVPAWTKWLNEKYGTNVHTEDITEWHIAKFFPTIPAEEVFAPLKDEEFWKTVYPIPMASYYLNKLMEDGVEVYICTSTDYHSASCKLSAIIDSYFPFIDWRQVITAHNKQMVCCDVIVDDGIQNLEGHSAHKILFTTPVNATYDAEGNGMYRANTWHEVYDIIQSIRKKFP